MFDKKFLSRRDFLKITGVATGGIVASAAFPQVLGLSEKTIQQLRRGEGTITWKNTACRLCPGGCSLSIKRLNEVPISLKGNTLSPINRGGTCPATYANLEILYHPDRLTIPMARPEGPIQKELLPVSWDEALGSLSRNIQDLITRNQTYKIAIINGDDSPVMQEIWRNFANWLGTPNYYQESHVSYGSNSARLTQGVDLEPTFDIINADCIISLGANFLEEDGASVHFNQVISQFKDLSNVTRNKLVYVGPRANITAASSHRWIPLNPDTWGALALGLAHLLMDSPKVDLGHLRKNSHGFGDWKDAQGRTHEGFEKLVRSEFHPKRVEEITGIPEEDIVDLANLIIERDKPVILSGSEAQQSPRGDFHSWAAHCLNYMLGAVQQPGGWYFDFSSQGEKLFRQEFKGKDVQNLFKTNEAHPLEKPSLDIFAKRVEGYAPYSIELIIINRANPVYYGENRTKWKTLLKHVPRVVFIGDLPNETSAHADVLLPTHSPLEDWDLVEDIPGVPVASATLQRPVLDPMYDTKSSYDILKTVAASLPGIEPRIFPGKNAKTVVKKRLQKIYSDKKGLLYAEQTKEDWARMYMDHEPVSITTAERTFLKALLKVGGWWDPAGRTSTPFSQVLNGSVKRFDFMSPLLKSYDGSARDEVQSIKMMTGSRYPTEMEKYTASDSAGYPLTLMTGYPITNPYGRTVYSPTLVETFGHLREIHWENWVEIHPETARKMGVRDGTKIQLDSPVGVIKVRARVRPIIHPDVVFIPLGLGREGVGRFTSGVGTDPRELIVAQPEVNRGNIILSGTPVRITIG
ncbi:MAG: molybdopterin-dependent oxidoreductase [FCB group bacterium]|nr:molybdopterin-dependent oxidoreductase [FCB group bacterium]